MITPEWRAHAKNPGEFPGSVRGTPRISRREAQAASKHDLFYWLYAVRLPAVVDADLDTYPRELLRDWVIEHIVKRQRRLEEVAP